jgi:hypothetical protein
MERDVLIRFFLKLNDKRIGNAPRTLLSSHREDTSYPNGDGDECVGERKINRLRNMRFDLLLRDLNRHGYSVSRVHLHRTEHTDGTRWWRVTMGLTRKGCVQESNTLARNIDWCMRSFFADGKTVLVGDSGSLTIPKDGMDARYAVLVHVFMPRVPTPSAPTFALRFDGRKFWIQDPDNSDGDLTEIDEDQANALVAWHNAPEEARSRASAAAKAVLRQHGATVDGVRSAALNAARKAFNDAVAKCNAAELYDDVDYNAMCDEANRLALEVCDGLNWAKLLKTRPDAD